MAKHNSDAVWSEIDPSSLNPATFKAYNEYVAARKLANEARKVFENMAQADANVADGKRMVFGYNFGKLSVAIVDGEVKASKPTKPKLSLADYLKAQR